jgi:hypothetical protein
VGQEPAEGQHDIERWAKSLPRVNTTFLSSHLIVQVGFGGTVKKASNEGLEPCQGDQI